MKPIPLYLHTYLSHAFTSFLLFLHRHFCYWLFDDTGEITRRVWNADSSVYRTSADSICSHSNMLLVIGPEPCAYFVLGGAGKRAVKFLLPTASECWICWICKMTMPPHSTSWGTLISTDQNGCAPAPCDLLFVPIHLTDLAAGTPTL